MLYRDTMSLWKSLSKRSMLLGTGARVMCPNQSMNRNPGTLESSHRVVLGWWFEMSSVWILTKWPTVKDIYLDLKCVVQYRIVPTPKRIDCNIATSSNCHIPEIRASGACFSVWMSIAQEVAIHGLQNGIQPEFRAPFSPSLQKKISAGKRRNQLAEGDANAPNLDQRDCRCRRIGSKMCKEKEKSMKNERQKTNGMKLVISSLSVLSFASKKMSATFLCSQGNVQVRLGDDLVLTFINKEPGQHHNQIRFLNSKSAMLRN